MAVFRQELNWSTYQDKQLRILQSLDKSFQNSLQMSQRISNSLDKVEYSMKSIARELVSDVGAFNRGINEAGNSISSFYNSVNKSNEGMIRFSRELEDTGKKFHNFAADFTTIITNIKNQFGGFRNIAEQANNYSALSNQMILLSGMRGDIVRDFRTDIVDRVNSLNANTGSYYNPTKSYEKLISISQGITSDLDSITEMSKPLLLASETLDVNINTVANLFNRFYTRYKFSSTDMQNTLTEIRGNTAGNSANAEATMRNISALETWINNYAINDNETRTELMKKVSNYTSWIESIGLDSSKFTDYLNSIAYGDYADNTELVNILSRGGLSATSATDLVRSGNFDGITSSIMDGVYDIMKQFDINGDGVLDDITSLGKVLDNYRLDREFAMGIWNVKNSQGYSTLGEFMEEVDKNSNTSLEQLVSDKYVSAEDKLTNTLLDKIYKVVADIQEHLPFGLSDVLIATALLKGTGIGPKFSSGGGGILNGGFLGSTGTSALRGSGLLGLLSTGGYNLAGTAGASMSGTAALGVAGLGLAGIGAGVGLGIHGISGLVDPNASASSKIFSGIEAAGGGIGSAAIIATMLGASINPLIAPIALGAGATAIALKKLYDEVTPVSGAAGAMSKQFDELNKSLNDSAIERIKDLNLLKDTIEKTDDFTTALELAKSSGLLDFTDKVVSSRDELMNLIDATVGATDSLMTMNNAVLAAAKSIANEEAKKQTTRVSGDLVQAIGSMMTTSSSGTVGLERSADEVGFSKVQATFEQLANSISDADAREKFSGDISQAFKDGTLTANELKILTDTGGFKLGMSRNNSVFGQDSANLDSLNAALAILGVSGFDLQENTNASNLATIYNNWVKSTNPTDKAKYLKEFKDLYDATNSSVRSPYDEYAKNMGILSYAIGTNLIGRDQIAVLHEGEAVTPKRYNPMANMNELEMLREQARSNQQEGSSTLHKYLEDSNTVLSEIKEFLSDWRYDNIRRENLNNRKSKFSALNSGVSSYFSQT